MVDAGFLLLLIAVGVVTLYLALAPVGECDVCPHCRREKLERRRRRHLELHKRNLCVDPDCPYSD